jgi:aspartate/methionine/tyrosine aminotransferase
LINIKEAAKRAIDDNQTHYGPSAGMPGFREAVASYVSRTRGIDVSPDEVVATPGGKPIIFFSILACVDEADEVIYPNPGFPIYESMINFVGAKPVPLPLLENREFSFDIDQLKDKISERTSLIIINSPQNPTGGVIAKEDLKQLADEIYSRIVYEGRFESITHYAGMKDRTIILDGHSKTYSMTGWRLGYGVMPKYLAARIARLMTNSNSCTATFTQLAGIEALTGPQEDAIAMVEEFRERRDLIVDGLNDIEGISCLKPHGAFYVFPNVTGVCRGLGFVDSKQLQQFLLYRADVAVLGRSCFGVKNVGEDQEYLRFSYAASKADIAEGLRRISNALADKGMVKEFLEKQDRERK